MLHWVPDVCIGGTLDLLMTKPVTATTEGNRFTVFDLRFDCRYIIQVRTRGEDQRNGHNYQVGPRKGYIISKIMNNNASSFGTSDASGPGCFVNRQARSHVARQRQRPGMQRHFGHRADNASVRAGRRDSLYAPTSTAGIPGPHLQGITQGSQGSVEMGLSQKLASLYAVGMADRLGQKAEKYVVQGSLLLGQTILDFG